VLEETGILVEPERLTGVYKHLTLGVVALVFRCRRIAGTAVPTAESAEVCWMTTGEVTIRMVPAFAVRITDALLSQTVSIRHHDGTNLRDRG
jgi:8-oxo-dGTP diphosphatase